MPFCVRVLFAHFSKFKPGITAAVTAVEAKARVSAEKIMLEAFKLSISLNS